MRVAAVLMVAALLFPALAYSAEVQEGSARAPNESVDLIGGVDLGNRWPIFVDSLGRMRVIPMVWNGTAWDSLRSATDGSGRTLTVPMAYNGSTWDSLRVDSNGILRIVDEYPDNYQTEIQAIAENFQVNARHISAPIITMVGNSVSAHPFGYSVLHVEKTSHNLGVRLYLYGSYDDEVFTPVSSVSAWGGTFDTLQVHIPADDVSARIPLLIDNYPGRYLALYGWADSTADSSVVVTVKWEGRQD